MPTLKKYLWLSQASLFACLLLCTILLPSVAIKNGGVSNFGNHVLTVIPYVTGFVANAVFINAAAIYLVSMNKHFKTLAQHLKAISELTIVVLLSTFPRHFSFTWSEVHDYLGIALFSYEFVLSVWLVVKRPTPLAFSFIFIEAAGSLIGLLSILKVVHFLFIGQIVGALGFALVFVLVFPDVVALRLPATD